MHQRLLHMHRYVKSFEEHWQQAYGVRILSYKDNRPIFFI